MCAIQQKACCCQGGICRTGIFLAFHAARRHCGTRPNMRVIPHTERIQTMQQPLTSTAFVAIPFVKVKAELACQTRCVAVLARISTTNQKVVARQAKCKNQPKQACLLAYRDAATGRKKDNSAWRQGGKQQPECRVACRRVCLHVKKNLCTTRQSHETFVAPYIRAELLCVAIQPSTTLASASKSNPDRKVATKGP